MKQQIIEIVQTQAEVKIHLLRAGLSMGHAHHLAGTIIDILLRSPVSAKEHAQAYQEILNHGRTTQTNSSPGTERSIQKEPEASEGARGGTGPDGAARPEGGEAQQTRGSVLGSAGSDRGAGGADELGRSAPRSDGAPVGPDQNGQLHVGGRGESPSMPTATRDDSGGAVAGQSA